MPVSLEDQGGGRVVLHAAAVDPIKAAAGEALSQAADALLASIPTAILEDAR